MYLSFTGLDLFRKELIYLHFHVFGDIDSNNTVTPLSYEWLGLSLFESWQWYPSWHHCHYPVSTTINRVNDHMASYMCYLFRLLLVTDFFLVNSDIRSRVLQSQTDTKEGHPAYDCVLTGNCQEWLCSHVIIWNEDDLNLAFEWASPCTWVAVFIKSAPQQCSGPRLNIKTVLSTYGDFHVKDKTAVRTSYL